MKEVICLVLASVLFSYETESMDQSDSLWEFKDSAMRRTASWPSMEVLDCLKGGRVRANAEKEAQRNILNLELALSESLRCRENHNDSASDDRKHEEFKERVRVSRAVYPRLIDRLHLRYWPDLMEYSYYFTGDYGKADLDFRMCFLSYSPRQDRYRLEYLFFKCSKEERIIFPPADWFSRNPKTLRMRFEEIGDAVTIDDKSVTITEFPLKQCKTVCFPIGSRLNVIADGAFSDCSLVRVLGIPTSVTVIGPHAFSGCKQLEYVTFEDPEHSHLTEIREFAFQGSGIKSFAVPPSVEQIGDSAFEACQNLTSVTFSENSRLRYVGGSAFSKTPIKEIEIPGSVEKLGNWTFSDCSALRKVTFAPEAYLQRMIDDGPTDSDLQKIVNIANSRRPDGSRIAIDDLKNEIRENDGVLYKCPLIVEALSSRITEIGYSCFARIGIYELAVPASVKVIGSRCFHGTPLKRVILCRDSNGKCSLRKIDWGALAQP